MDTTTGLRTYDDAAALVTGGASGIGRALCHELAARGATVIAADIQADKARDVAARIKQQGGRAEGVELDVRDCAAVKSLVDGTAEQHGRLDYLFNNAGIVRSAPTLLYSIDDWHSVLDVNLRGVVHGVHAAYPLMVNQGFGHIVNTSSLAGLIPWLGPAYTAAKFAVVGLSTSLRGEAAVRGVRVSVLCPGAVKTHMFGDEAADRETPDALRDLPPERILSHVQFMDPTDFARVALRGVARNRAIIVTPRRALHAWRWFRLAPRLIMGLREALLRRASREAEAKGRDPAPSADPERRVTGPDRA